LFIELFANPRGNNKEGFPVTINKKRILVAGNNFIIGAITNSKRPSFML
jgi:hypothetical protein